MTLREIIYMIMDELKIMSDDSTFNENHIKFLVNKYRITLLNQQYAKTGGVPDNANYQTVDLNLEVIKNIEYLSCSEKILKSKENIPNILNISNTRIYPNDFSDYRINIVSEDRFKFVGFNRWTQNIIFGTIKDNYLYLKSNNPQFLYLENVTLKGIFADDYNNLDEEYPLEAGLVPLLIQSIVQELSPKTIQPEDSYNNASDDKANLTRYLASNTKSDLAKQLS